VEASKKTKNKRHPAVLISAIAAPLLAVGATLFLSNRQPTPTPAAAKPVEKTQPTAAPSASPPTPGSPAPEQKAQPDPKPDPKALRELIGKLDAKLLSVPGTDVLMSKTELTVGEWKLYLRARGLPPWEHPENEVAKEEVFKKFIRKNGFKGIEQTDEHPRMTSWDQAKEMCDWLTANTGSTWRMSNNAEWEKAAGASTYPWGDSYPPKWDDGNYAAREDGSRDPDVVGIDGIRGPGPVASFKPNALGFYDLGGNVSEWMEDGTDARGWRRVRGSGSFSPTTPEWLRTANNDYSDPRTMAGWNGFRIVRLKTAEEKAASSPVATAPSPGIPTQAPSPAPN
jgi:formylglycine-generating enzyme required for sulfatase activity